jgi:hypothetical protein
LTCLASKLVPGFFLGRDDRVFNFRFPIYFPLGPSFSLTHAILCSAQHISVMACCGISIQRLRPCSSMAWLLLLVVVVAAVFTQPSSCCRPFKGNSNGDGANNNIIALPATGETTREEGGKLLWLLFSDMKPRGRAPPSAPSKRTN